MHLFEPKHINRYTLFQKRKPTIEELCSGKIYDVKKALDINKRNRSDFFNTTNGYTKTRTRRLLAELPFEVFKHKEMGKYFDINMDSHERKKETYNFLKKYPQFMSVDKL